MGLCFLIDPCAMHWRGFVVRFARWAAYRTIQSGPVLIALTL